MNKYASDTRYITTKSLFEKILIDLAEGSVFLVVDKPTSPIFEFHKDKKDKFGGHWEIRRGLNTKFFQSAAEYLLASVKHPDYDYDIDEDDSQGVVTNLSIEDLVEKDKLILKKNYLSKNKTFEKIATKEIKKSYSKGSRDLEEIGLIQKALKELKFDIKEDKDFGVKTKEIIKTFQESYKPTHKIHKDYTLGKKKDGIVGRNTLLALDEACVEGWEYEEKIAFPLSFVPTKSYKEGMRKFGYPRTNGRKHAGCDLYAPVGTKIYAMADGVILEHTRFYRPDGKTWVNEIAVKHSNLIARYGEVKPDGKGIATGLKVGSKVKQGQHIGYVGLLKFKSGKTMSMLHLEIYKGTKTGSLTNRSNTPYQRRDDL